MSIQSACTHRLFASIQLSAKLRNIKMKRWVLIVGVIAIEVAMGFALLPWTNRATINTTDFVNFYAAATIVRQGHAASLYQAQTQGPALAAILGHSSLEYFLHPPFFAAALAPLSHFPIEKAFLIWTLFNMALLGSLPFLFSRCTEFVKRRPQLGLLGILFAPVIIALTLGQDSILLLFLFGVGYILLDRGREAAAGFVLAAATIKFQYALVFVGFLFLQRKWKLAAAFALGCSLLLACSILMFGIDGIRQYVSFVRDYDLSNGYGTLLTHVMVNSRGFISGIGWPGHARLCALIMSAALLAFGAFCVRFVNPRNASLAFSLYLTLALLASPYAFFQDATLLLLPLYLATDYVIHETGRLRGALAVSCGLLFLSPIAPLLYSGHYSPKSPIFLLFPVILAFALSLAVELFWTRTKTAGKLRQDQKCVVAS